MLEPLHERNLVVVDGFAPALQRCWPSCDDWKRAEHRCQPETPADLGEGENASMFWPWVGQHYHRGGI